MGASHLRTIVDRFSAARLLCIGDMMLDVFVYGKSSRLSPEAPVPVMLFGREKRMPGGAGNVVSNLRSLGCAVHFLGVAGQDAEGQELLDFLQGMGAEPELLTPPGLPTPVKTRYVAGGHHLLRVDREQKTRLTPELREHLLQRVEALLPSAELVLMSDYGKGLFDLETAPAIIECCRKAGKTVVVDPKQMDYSYYRGASMVKPNLKEFSGAVGCEFDAAAPDFAEEAVRAGRELCRRFDIDNILVTLSEHGMLFIPGREDARHFIIPTEAQEVFDVSGAGDTSLATLGAALAVGAGMEQAIRLANVASGIVVGKFGTACATPAEIRAGLSPASAAGCVSREDAAALVRSLKAQGKVVGFTNGCFDILHPGHLQSFVLAKQECDVLIVGMNSDASVRRLKGPERPVNDERSRAAMLAALKPVDYVVVFDDDTALPLIDELRPDVIAKEGYPLDRWPEGRAVIAYGGRAVELPRLPGFSTTGIINKLS